MKHLVYGIMYTLILSFADSGYGGLLAVVLFLPLVLFVLAVRKSPGTSSSAVHVNAETCCRVLEPPTSTSVEDNTNTVAINGTGVTPRRQRSLRERTGIDGKLDKLNANSVLPNTERYLAPSPSVSPRVNAEFSRPVRKADFAEHVRFMSQESDAGFIQEYKDLNQVGRGQPCTAADLACNRPKNRFANILPYDHSRVKLTPIDGVDGSDYINASYIPGYNGRKEFICTQGPLLFTRDDFWRMVWEQNSIAIVNLTRCLEKGREKCDRYWPNADSAQYGNIRVRIINERKLVFGTIRELQVTSESQSRTIHQFHYTSWPDFGVPERPQALVKFVRSFRAHCSALPSQSIAGPVIVHCSAGVGRSGTMIAIDRILQQLRDHDDIDVYGVVYEMRRERYWMVQTEQQYIFIHQCILCVLEGREDEENVSQPPHHSTPNSPLADIPNSSLFA